LVKVDSGAPPRQLACVIVIIEAERGT